MARPKVNKVFTVYENFDVALEEVKKLPKLGSYAFYVQIDNDWFRIGYTNRVAQTLEKLRISIDGTLNEDGSREMRSGIVAVLGPNDNSEAAVSIVKGLLAVREKNKRTKPEPKFDSNTFKVEQKKLESMIIRNL